MLQKTNIWIWRNGSCCEVSDDELEGKPCFVGVDLSKRLDLTAVTSIFVLGEGKYAVKK